MEYLTTLWHALVVDLTSAKLFFGIGVLSYAGVLAKWHSDESKFDFRESLIEPETGRVSLSRLGQLTALATSTAILVYIALTSGSVPEWMFAAYMAAWAGTYIAAKYAPKDTTKDN